MIEALKLDADDSDADENDSGGVRCRMTMMKNSTDET
jgi:hypothetical protein